MASLNMVQIIGNLGKEPEMRYTGSGQAMCTISVATTETYKDAAGNKKESTEWHRVVLHRGLAEHAERVLKKGSQVYISGRIKTDKWQDKDGQTRYTTRVEAHEMKLLNKAAENAAGSHADTHDSLPH